MYRKSKGEVAVITGAASGIGQALALERPIGGTDRFSEHQERSARQSKGW
jgi:short-subunit dehydrogenase involved in D-alanine esterification of teichoic acids